jgi:hypothetical protein
VTVRVVAVEVDLVETDLVDAVFFDVRLFFVLYGLAAGARRMLPSGLIPDDAGAGCFFFVAAVSIA